MMIMAVGQVLTQEITQKHHNFILVINTGIVGKPIFSFLFFSFLTSQECFLNLAINNYPMSRNSMK